ncbi:MAG: Lrp/AsnC family transcriptional regulator [Myxococcota bacterium]
MDLDRIDFEIIAALQNDARVSNKELAATVGLAPSSCLMRVRSLRERGVIRGFHADVDPAALGIGVQCLIAVRLRHHDKPALDALYRYLATLPEVTSFMNVSGASDVLVHAAVADVAHLRDFIVEKLATRAEVDHCETSVIYDEQRRPVLPNYRGG